MAVQEYISLIPAPAVVGTIAVMFFFVTASLGYLGHKLHQQNKATADVAYPAYGVVGPATVIKVNETHGRNATSGDQKLAESAEMYQYQSQKQQISSNSNSPPAAKKFPSVSDSEDDNESESGYVVYECPGLASTGEMEVRNPLFQDASTPNSPSKVSGSVNKK